MELDIEATVNRWLPHTGLHTVLAELYRQRERAERAEAQRDRLADAIKSWSRTVLEDMGLE